MDDLFQLCAAEVTNHQPRAPSFACKANEITVERYRAPSDIYFAKVLHLHFTEKAYRAAEPLAIPLVFGRIQRFRQVVPITTDQEKSQSLAEVCLTLTLLTI